MPNIASVLKAEVARVARKELRSQTDGLKKTFASQRSDIAALKRQVHDLQRALKTLVRVASGKLAPPQATASDIPQFRFRAQGMASNRKRLGLSAADFGLLIGATGQSVYAWESGKSKPRAQNLAAIAALRGIGKREAKAKLAGLKRG